HHARGPRAHLRSVFFDAQTRHGIGSGHRQSHRRRTPGAHPRAGEFAARRAFRCRVANGKGERMSEKMRICISSPPDRKRLVAELFLDNEQWAELNQEGNRLELEIYPKLSGSAWRLDFEDVLNVLAEVKKRLVGA